MRLIGTAPNQDTVCSGVHFLPFPGYGLVSEDLPSELARDFLSIGSYKVYDGPELTYVDAGDGTPKLIPVAKTESATPPQSGEGEPSVGAPGDPSAPLPPTGNPDAGSGDNSGVGEQSGESGDGEGGGHGDGDGEDGEGEGQGESGEEEEAGGEDGPPSGQGKKKGNSKKRK